MRPREREEDRGNEAASQSGDRRLKGPSASGAIFAGRARQLRCAIVAVLCTSAASAVADPLKFVVVRLDAPPGCPDQITLIARLRQDLEGSQGHGEPLQFHVGVEKRGPNAWRALLRIQGNAGSNERVFTARSCESLFDAASLIIATVIAPETAVTNGRAVDSTGTRQAPSDVAATAKPSDPQSSTQTTPATATAGSDPQSSTQTTPPTAAVSPDSRSSGQPVPPTVNRAPPVATTQQPNKPATATPVTASTKKANQPTTVTPSPIATPPANKATLGVMAADPTQPTPETPATGLLAGWVVADSGSLPALTPAFGGAVGVLWRSLRAEAALGWWRPQNESVNAPPNPTAGGRFGMVAGAAKACFKIWRMQGFSLSPCGGFEVARWSGEGNDSLEQKKETPLWGVSAVAAAMGVLEGSDTLAFRANIDVPVILSRPVFGFYEDGKPVEVFGPNRVVLRAGVGVELRFR